MLYNAKCELMKEFPDFDEKAAMDKLQKAADEANNPKEN